MLIVAAAGVLAGYGASRTVSNVTELYEAIEALNFKSSSIIYLNKGDYDLSGGAVLGLRRRRRGDSSAVRMEHCEVERLAGDVAAGGLNK